MSKRQNVKTSKRQNRAITPAPRISNVVAEGEIACFCQSVAGILTFRRFDVLTFLLAMLLLTGCGSRNYYPDRATQPYPFELHAADSINIQVFRDDTTIELVNATGTTYADFDLWLNQRWVRRVESLPAGGRLRLSLWEFYDERGETMEAGGFWRTREPTPIRLVQIQTGEQSPLLGLIAVRDEPLEQF